jgi:hypothetical protein
MCPICLTVAGLVAAGAAVVAKPKTAGEEAGSESADLDLTPSRDPAP